ncbi:hypothetical protein [Brassicibacter mesophilus]|uniref:hypothetical protein n=1 Tax=Brassicibacter mesophilus TaxID=745119 RepID=UPI003D1B39D3
MKKKYCIKSLKQNIVLLVISGVAGHFYSSVILMNTRIKNLSGFETTVVQLISSVVTLLPMIIFNNSTYMSKTTLIGLLFILILGIFYTGIAYLLYFLL